jgi:hypothetical protein
MPRRRPCQQHVRDVGTGNEQHEPDRTEEDEERGPNVADDHRGERRHRHGGIRPRKRSLEIRGDRGHLRLCRLHGRTAPESREQAQALRLPARRACA